MKHQILVVHGGNSFTSYPKYIQFLKSWRIDIDRYLTAKTDWKGNLSKSLGKKYEVIRLDMPGKLNARYLEWKIWFEKFLPHIRKGVILIGHSLGALFLIKYLSENKLPKKPCAIMFVSAPQGEGDFKLKKNLDQIAKQCEKIFLYHSEDDKVVPLSDFLKYRKTLKNTTGKVFKDRGHFNQEKFPEIVKEIKKLCS
ncbi:MAG: hypothetical protein LiPW15_230 [Parcubacteria group bacterium LiPW_15]|nr:MAG: hypothetical protein LiPW15_230 [Parcubacteria group bacterium LiPW_15]